MLTQTNSNPLHLTWNYKFGSESDWIWTQLDRDPNLTSRILVPMLIGLGRRIQSSIWTWVLCFKFLSTHIVLSFRVPMKLSALNPSLNPNTQLSSSFALSHYCLRRICLGGIIYTPYRNASSSLSPNQCHPAPYFRNHSYVTFGKKTKMINDHPSWKWGFTPPWHKHIHVTMQVSRISKL